MKILKTILLNAVLCLCLLHTSAQNRTVPVNEPDRNKPHLFDDLPQRMQLQTASLESLFSLPVGSAVKTSIADNFTFQGTIISSANQPLVKSVVIKSINRQGATLTFTKIIRANGTYAYIGRILSMKHGDAYEIAQEKGIYTLQKKDLNDMMNE